MASGCWRNWRTTRCRVSVDADQGPAYPKSSPGYFANARKRLKDIVESGQLGIFANGYWGHPACKLPSHATRWPGRGAEHHHQDAYLRGPGISAGYPGHRRLLQGLGDGRAQGGPSPIQVIIRTFAACIRLSRIGSDRVWGWWRLSLSSALRGGDVAATSPRLNTCCRKVELNSLISVFSKVSANRDVNRVTASGCSPVLLPPLYRAGGFDPPPALYSAIEARSSVSGFFLPHLPQGRCDSCVSNRQVQRSCSLKLWIQSGLTVCWKTASKSS